MAQDDVVNDPRYSDRIMQHNITHTEEIIECCYKHVRAKQLSADCIIVNKDENQLPLLCNSDDIVSKSINTHALPQAIILSPKIYSNEANLTEHENAQSFLCGNEDIVKSVNNKHTSLQTMLSSKVSNSEENVYEQSFLYNNEDIVKYGNHKQTSLQTIFPLKINSNDEYIF